MPITELKNKNLMLSCCIEIVSQTASFRNPEFQNFHKSLNLPPPTTIIGLAGAALGLSPKMAQEYFDNHLIEVGIAGFYQGKTKDTWKYNRRTSGMHLYDPLLDGGVIQREHLIHNSFFLAFSSKEEVRINEIIEAFQNPVFALTMGNSDALAKVKNVHTDVEISRSGQIKNCMVAGDIVGDVLRNASEHPFFSIYQNSEPITFDLPIRFNYESDYGKREVSEISTFSFVEAEMQLNFDIKGVQLKDIFIPIFHL
jgi:CRISPR-associated protein Cas5t